MRPHVLVDFTQDKKAIYGALNQLRMPGFAETNLFDALYDTLIRLDPLDGLEGGKSTSSCYNRYRYFSKLNLDQIMKRSKPRKTSPFPDQRRFHRARILPKCIAADTRMHGIR